VDYGGAFFFRRTSTLIPYKGGGGLRRGRENSTKIDVTTSFII